MGTDTIYPALVQHNDLVRVHQRSNTLGNDKLSGIGDFVPQCLPDTSVRVGVHGTGGVVQNQDLRLFQQCSGNTDSLAFPSLICDGYLAR